MLLVCNSCDNDDQIIYPQEGRLGLNIINETDSVFEYKGNYSISAILPEGQYIVLKPKSFDGSQIAISTAAGVGWAYCWTYPINWDDQLS